MSDKDRAERHEMEKDSEMEAITMNCMECDAEVVGDSLCEDCKIKYRDDYPELMKAEIKANPDKWAVYGYYLDRGFNYYNKLDKPTWKEFVDHYKLILKEHEHIADAVIKNPNVEVECTSLYGDDSNPIRFPEQGDWFKWYNPEYKYQLAKPQCDGKGIKQICDNPEVNNLFKDEPKGWDDKMNWTEPPVLNSIEEELTYEEAKKPLHGIGEEEMQISGCCQANIIPESIDMCGKCYEHCEVIESSEDFDEIISIGKYKFEKPEYLTELFAIRDNEIYGRYFHREKWFTAKWDLNGKRYAQANPKTNLNRINKPKWYEDESNFPCLMANDKNEIHIIPTSDNIKAFIVNGWRLATLNDINSLYYQDKE